MTRAAHGAPAKIESLMAIASRTPCASRSPSCVKLPGGRLCAPIRKARRSEAEPASVSASALLRFLALTIRTPHFYVKERGSLPGNESQVRD